MFTRTDVEIFLFEYRLVLSPVQWVTGIERVEFLVKNQKKMSLLKLFEK